jgi:hypothetical protein
MWQLCSINMTFSDIKGTDNIIKFDVNSNGSHEMILNSIGLGIGNNSPSANLSVQGNATVTTTLSIGTSSSQSNLNLQGTLGYGIGIISTNTLLNTKTVYVIDTDTAGGNLNLTLPHAADISGREITIKKKTGNHEVHILGEIENNEKLTLPSSQSNNLAHVSLISNGSSWYILSQSSQNTSGNVVASSNLIHHWKFDDTSGSTATNSANNANPGSMTNMTFENNAVTGRIGTALEFDGTDDYVTVGDLDEIELTPLTVAFWAKVDNTTGDYDFFVKGNHTTFEPIIIWFDDLVGGVADLGASNVNTISVLVYDGTTQHWVSAPNNAIATAEWNHIAVVISPATGDLSIYVNGELEATNNKAWNGIEASADQLHLGSDVDQTYELDGCMDDIRIYNKVLTASEIREIYQLGAQE